MDLREDRVERGQIAVNVVQRRDPHRLLSCYLYQARPAFAYSFGAAGVSRRLM
jgi:hypothetical protein